MLISMELNYYGVKNTAIAIAPYYTYYGNLRSAVMINPVYLSTNKDTNLAILPFFLVS